MARAPAQAADAVSDVVGTAGRAATSVKEGAYGAVDAVERLAAMPAEIAEKRRRGQEVCDVDVMLSACEFFTRRWCLLAAAKVVGSF